MRVLIFLMSLISCVASAQIWDNVTTTKTGTAYFIDPSSIVKIDDIVSYNQLINYPNSYDSESKKIHSIHQSKKIDCSKNLIKTVSMIAYESENAKGNILTLSVGREYKWMKINQNSISSHYKDDLCR
jgi:hypothetical protein